MKLHLKFDALLPQLCIKVVYIRSVVMAQNTNFKILIIITSGVILSTAGNIPPYSILMTQLPENEVSNLVDRSIQVVNLNF